MAGHEEIPSAAPTQSTADSHLIGGSGAASTLPAPPQPRVDDRLGPYRLLQKVGEGHFGVVYLAEQSVPIRRRVALKIIKPGMDSKAVIARFEAERQALAIMDHPNIARVIDAGVTDPAMGSRPYFVMDYVAGEPITEYCDRQRLTIRQRLELFIPVCEAVQHAHMKGVIHRDIKPSNVLVGFSDNNPVPKVIDFGVAKAISHRLTEQTIFTEQGQIIGTPEYMSPEQAEMNAVDIDTRSDVYSLGVLLYELLIGALPFDGAMLRMKGYNEIQRIIREQEPPKPSTKLTSLGPEDACKIGERRQSRIEELTRLLRSELEWIPLKAMRKDRIERYRSAQEMGLDLRNYLEGKALQAGPESTVYRLRKFARRYRTGVAVVTTIILAMIVGIGGLVWGMTAALRSRDDTARALQAVTIEQQKTKDAATEAANQARAAQWQSYVANIRAAQVAVENHDRREAQRRLEAAPEHLRGWEWKWLSAQLDTSIHTFSISELNPIAVFFTPTDAIAMVASNGKYIQWSNDTFEQQSSVDLTPGSVCAVSGDRTRFAVLAWNDVTPTTGTFRRTATPVISVYAISGELISGITLPKQPQDFFPSLAMDATGAVVILVNANAAIYWDVATSEPVAISPPIDFELRTVTHLHGSHWLFASQTELFVWEKVAGFKPKVSLGQSYLGGSSNIASSTNGLIAVPTFGGLALFGLETGKPALPILRQPGVVFHQAFHSTEPRLLAAYTDLSLRIWDTTTGDSIHTMIGHNEPPRFFHLNTKADRLVSAARNEVKLWDMRSRPPVPTERILAFGFVENEPIEVVASRQLRGVVARHRLTKAERCHFLPPMPSKGKFREFLVRSNDFLFMTGDELHRVNLQSGQTLPTVSSSKVGASLSFGKQSIGYTSALMAVQDENQGIVVLDTATGETVTRIPTQVVTNRWNPMISDDGRLLAAGSFRREDVSNFSILIWELASGQLRCAYPMESFQMQAELSIDPLCSRIAVGDYTRGQLVLLSTKCQKIWGIQAHDAGITSIAWLSDGSRIVTGSADHSVRLWDPSTGELMLMLKGHEGIVTEVAVSKDGQCIMSGVGTKSMLWDCVAQSVRYQEEASETRIVAQLTPYIELLWEKLLDKNEVIKRVETNAKLTSEERTVALRLARSIRDEVAAAARLFDALGELPEPPPPANN